MIEFYACCNVCCAGHFEVLALSCMKSILLSLSISQGIVSWSFIMFHSTSLCRLFKTNFNVTCPIVASYSYKKNGSELCDIFLQLHVQKGDGEKLYILKGGNPNDGKLVGGKDDTIIHAVGAETLERQYSSLKDLMINDRPDNVTNWNTKYVTYFIYKYIKWQICLY